jgi:S-adenosylmethionine:tRNA ribosyltransferase-isomerase
MRTADFDFDLPPDLIAQEPAARRDHARMLVVHRETGRIDHRGFKDFPTYLRHEDVVVLNNTRVIQARIFGRKERSSGKVELLILEEVERGLWDVLLRARRRPRPGERAIFADGQAVVTLIEDRELGRALVRVESDRPFMDLLEEYGETPLPPYIRRSVNRDPSSVIPSTSREREPPVTGKQEPVTGHRSPVTDFSDKERYQTIYARERGAVAAPTAGLHFTPEILKRVEQAGAMRAEITLHVGLGTFRPVTADSVEDHVMDSERYAIGEEAAERIRGAGRVVAVGSTTVRTLEHVAATRGRIEACAGRSDLFIRPPYRFRAVGAMLTNFHLPKSTLIMMVCAFGGRELIMSAYAEAIRERYRFYSYGDCMLVL